MTLLAIDTSSAYASVAVYDGARVLAEETWHARRRHDDQLFPAIERVLHLAAVALADVTRVAVAIGPGSFTGIRVGIAAAQGIARGSRAALTGVPTLDAVAHPYAGLGRRVCVLIDAGRGEHYAAVYRARRGRWGRTSAVQVGTLADIARTTRMETLFAGDVDEAVAAELRELLGPRARVPAPSLRARRAGPLAELGWARFEAGEAVEPGALEPLYIRPPAIRERAGDLVGATETAPPASAPRLEA